MRVFLAIIGAIAGLSLASGSHELFGIALGAFAGFAVGELSALRGKLKALEDELVALRKSMAQQARRDSESIAAASSAARSAGPANPTSTPPGTPPSAGAWEPYGVAAN